MPAAVSRCAEHVADVAAAPSRALQHRPGVACPAPCHRHRSAGTHADMRQRARSRLHESSVRPTHPRNGALDDQRGRGQEARAAGRPARRAPAERGDRVGQAGVARVRDAARRALAGHHARDGRVVQEADGREQVVLHLRAPRRVSSILTLVLVRTWEEIVRVTATPKLMPGVFRWLLYRCWCPGAVCCPSTPSRA